MAREPVMLKIVLDKKVKPPAWFTNLKYVTLKREKVFDSSDVLRTVVNIRGPAFAGFLPGGAVDLKVSAFKRPLVVFEPLQVLMIVDILSQYNSLNYHFCTSCLTNSGELRSSEVRLSSLELLFECNMCGALWGHDT